MRCAKIISCIFSIFGACTQAQQQPIQGKRIMIAASTMLDGKGRVLHDTRIVIEGSRDSRFCPVKVAERLIVFG